jgi:ribokinase
VVNSASLQPPGALHPRVHVVGSMMIDRVVRVHAVPRAGETVAARSTATFAGGKGANQAAAAAKCGARVRMLGRTGADGRFIVDALRAAGVDVRAIAVDDPTAGAATVMVADNGENAIVIAPESNRRITPADIERFLAKVQPGDLVLFQNECSALHEGISLAAARAARVWLNAAPADGGLRGLRFEKLAGLVVNETEAEAMTGEADPRRALESLAARMPGGTVVVTLGAQGAIAACGSMRCAHRGFVVDAVDTVGCGDAFVGAALAALAAGCDLQQALVRGNAAGALAAMREGAMPALPDQSEVDAAAVRAEGSRLTQRAVAPLGGKPSRCEGCGYDLAANALGDACPECGRVVAPARFGGRWRDARTRRRFVLSAWMMALGAVLLVCGLAPLLLSEAGLIPSLRLRLRGRVVEGAVVGMLFASQLLLPIAMLLLLHNASGLRRRTVAEITMLARLCVFVGAALAVVFQFGGDWVGYTLFLLTTASDGLFVRELDRLGEGSAVARVPRPRIVVLAVIAVLTMGLWATEDFRGGLPYIAFIGLMAVACFMATEVMLFARRVRAQEQA